MILKGNAFVEQIVPPAHPVLSPVPAVRLRTTGQSLFQPERRVPVGEASPIGQP
jgi:hypothetical protein